MSEWERKDCPVCRDDSRVTSEEFTPDDYENECARCDVRWTTETPVEKQIYELTEADLADQKLAELKDEGMAPWQ